MCTSMRQYVVVIHIFRRPHRDGEDDRSTNEGRYSALSYNKMYLHKMVHELHTGNRLLIQLSTEPM